MSCNILRCPYSAVARDLCEAHHNQWLVSGEYSRETALLQSHDVVLTYEGALRQAMNDFVLRISKEETLARELGQLKAG